MQITLGRVAHLQPFCQGVDDHGRSVPKTTTSNETWENLMASICLVVRSRFGRPTSTMRMGPSRGCMSCQR
eukprot:scaffold230104_cov33-Tisochrysis_lutea.AAC.1